MNIACVGTGFIVDRFLEAAEINGTVHPAAIYTRKEENAVSLQNKYGIGSIYTSYEKMLADPFIDAVYIASPNSMHYTHALQAIQAGKNVLVEKPFCANSEQASHLIKTAEQYEVILMEAITTIHLPNFHQIEKEIRGLGPLRLIQCNYSQYSSRYDKLLAGETPNVFNPAFAGGALMDINLYNLYFTVRLFGRPQRVTYEANFHSNGIDTSGCVLLSYNNFKAICIGSKDTSGLNSALIQGEKGWLHVLNGVNGCREINVHINGEAAPKTIPQKENLMYYELAVFQDMVSKQDFKRAAELQVYTKDVMHVLDEARKSANLIFP
ncbi:Gfo/Idh/MocA family protein [Alkalicoccus halolimnae]|uniref:Gfo/Idh/MocA family oxidoreductase n=1 Tax=Alkalicoccus halolimnae TaxID=1667239 RepID=A0A5C7F6X5_9BACI|nr:Gfo/Idh/MocA family oxidoreductase [Alkalicoccus halolimnae]TXF85158.1 Gfo/Idh/MocA family oxidoreductase [Alkalicoccus halolimnae]